MVGHNHPANEGERMGEKAKQGCYRRGTTRAELRAYLLRYAAVILVVLSADQLGGGQAAPPSPREQLNQYVADLQQNPTDDALRKKLIMLAATLQPPPAVPEEARRHFVKADTLARGAHAPEDYYAAIYEYREALALAPWWGDAYHDLGIVLESAGRYDDATKEVKFYLLTNPEAKDARAAQDEIYKIEAKQQEATKRAAEAQRESAKREQEQAIQGTWTRSFSAPAQGRVKETLTIAQSALSWQVTLVEEFPDQRYRGDPDKGIAITVAGSKIEFEIDNHHYQDGHLLAQHRYTLTLVNGRELVGTDNQTSYYNGPAYKSTDQVAFSRE
jgi:tetratricopeptide (TPR) repeat protein